MISMRDIKGDLLASLLNERALLAVLVVGQLIAIVLSFSPLITQDPWLMLAPVSLFIHVISLASLSSLHLLKKYLITARYIYQLLILMLITPTLSCLFLNIFSLCF